MQHDTFWRAMADPAATRVLSPTEGDDTIRYLVLDLSAMNDDWHAIQREVPRDAVLSIEGHRLLIVGIFHGSTLVRRESNFATAADATRRWMQEIGAAIGQWTLAPRRSGSTAPPTLYLTDDDEDDSLLAVPRSALVTDPHYFARGEHPVGAYLMADVLRLPWDHLLTRACNECPALGIHPSLDRRTWNKPGDMRVVPIGYFDEFGDECLYTPEQAATVATRFEGDPTGRVYDFGGVTLRGWQIEHLQLDPDAETTTSGFLLDLLARQSQIPPGHPARRFLDPAWWRARDDRDAFALLGRINHSTHQVHLYRPDQWAAVSAPWQERFGKHFPSANSAKKVKVTA